MIIKLKPLLISLAITLGTGALAGLITMGSMDSYGTLTKPPLSPPGALFPIVWTILYVLMGVAAYLIYTSHSPDKRRALTLYGVQLGLNFLWPILFFCFHAYLFSFFWLVALWILILWTMYAFYQIRPGAAYLLVPYLLWVTFAGYLNLGIYLLN